MPKLPPTVTVTYTGGIDEVAILLPSGDRRIFKQGERADILRSDAESLSPEIFDGEIFNAVLNVESDPTPAPTGDDK